MGVENEGETRRSEDEDDWWESMMPKAQDPSAKKKKRKVHEVNPQTEDFTEEEMKVLVEEVTKRKEALFGDFMEDESPNSRWRVWLEVADKVNDISIKHRNVEQVRIKWFEHKDPVHKNCKLKKTVLYKKTGKQTISNRRYWHSIRRPIEDSSKKAVEQANTPTEPTTEIAAVEESISPSPNYHSTSCEDGAEEGISPHSTTQLATVTIIEQSIEPSQNNYSTSYEDGDHEKSLGDGQTEAMKDCPPEDIVILDEVSPKNSYHECEVIVIDDESAANEEGKSNTTVCGPNSTRDPNMPIRSTLEELNDFRNNRRGKRLSEEERVKEWLELTDEERKERIKRILNNLNDTPKKYPFPPRVNTPRPQICEKKVQHFMISMPEDSSKKFTAPLIKKIKHSNLSLETLGDVTATPSVVLKESTSKKNSPGKTGKTTSRRVKTYPSKIRDAVSSQSNNSDKSRSGILDQRESVKTNLSEYDNEDTSESGDINPCGGDDVDPSASYDANSSDESNESRSCMGKITEVYSMASAEEFHNTPSSDVNMSNNAVDEAASEQPSSNTHALKVSTEKTSKDSSPSITTEASQIIAIAQQPSIQSFQIVQPVGTGSSNIMTVVPVLQKVIQQVVLMPQGNKSELILMQEGKKVKSASSKGENSSRRNETSKKKDMSSSSNNAGSELMKEIFGGDPTCIEESSTHNPEKSTSSESINHGLNEGTKRPTKVYPGKKAVPKSTVQTGSIGRKDKRKQTLITKNVLDEEEKLDNHYSENVNKKSVPIKYSDEQDQKCSPILKGNGQNISSFSDLDGKEIEAIKDKKWLLKKNFTEKLSLKPIDPEKSTSVIVEDECTSVNERIPEVPESSNAVKNPRGEKQSPVKTSSSISSVSSRGRKRVRKDLGELRSAALLNQPVVLLDRLLVDNDDGKYVYKTTKKLNDGK